MNNGKKLVVGVDIGGTKIATGLVDTQGKILAHSKAPMIARGEAAKGLAAVSTAINELLSGQQPEVHPSAIGICAPGPLDPFSGTIINPPNLPIWHNYPLEREMRRVFKLDVKIDNDANAAALAEAKWGAGEGYRNVFYTCIGTGIGTGIVFDGRIYHGKSGAAGEGGHMGIDMQGPICNCGKHGCIETLASGPAIAQRARRKLEQGGRSQLLELAHGDLQAVSSELVGKACAAGDPLAKEVIEETLDVLAYWLGNVIDFLEPDVIIVGGGAAHVLTPFLPEIGERLRRMCVNPSPQNIPLVPAHYAEDAGIAGAAAICQIE
jgi:glucokinase